MKNVWLLFSILVLLANISIGQEEQDAATIEKYGQSLQKIFEVQKSIEKVHPFLKKLYPVAIAEDDTFYVFDLNPKKTRYEFVKQAQPAMIVPKGIRAAFPLDFYDNKMACVVSGEVFDDLSGYVMIFHEFIHCTQMETCEQELKNRLRVAQKAYSEDDFMWELNHPFPYEDSFFSELYALFLEAAANHDGDAVNRLRMSLRDMLNTEDYEYMVWQEWKEGFARYIENKIRKKLDLATNQSGLEQPYNRVTFYQGGAFYIAYLMDQDKDLVKDIEALFFRILGSV